MHNNTSQDEHLLARNQKTLPTTWTKPQLSATPLHHALSGGNSVVDGETTTATLFSS